MVSVREPAVDRQWLLTVTLTENVDERVAESATTGADEPRTASSRLQHFAGNEVL